MFPDLIVYDFDPTELPQDYQGGDVVDRPAWVIGKSQRRRVPPRGRSPRRLIRVRAPLADGLYVFELAAVGGLRLERWLVRVIGAAARIELLDRLG